MSDHAVVNPKLNPVVKAVGEMNFEGNIIPMCWFRHSALKTEAGKPNLPAIVLLSDIVYWYRPTEIRDEASGRLIESKAKFAGDKLQKSYQSWGEHFGLAKRQVKDAILFLERRGIIRRECRARVVTPDGRLLGNVTYLEPVPEKLKELELPERTLFTTGATPYDEKTSEGGLTKKRQRSDGKTSQLRRKNVIATAKKRQTNTETTTETNPKSDAGASPAADAAARGEAKKPKASDPQVWVKADAIYQAKWKARHCADYTIGRPEAIARTFILDRLGVYRDCEKALRRFTLVVDAYMADDTRDYYRGHPILRLKADIDHFIAVVAEGRQAKTQSRTANRGNQQLQLERDAAKRNHWGTATADKPVETVAL